MKTQLPLLSCSTSSSRDGALHPHGYPASATPQSSPQIYLSSMLQSLQWWWPFSSLFPCMYLLLLLLSIYLSKWFCMISFLWNYDFAGKHTLLSLPCRCSISERVENPALVSSLDSSTSGRRCLLGSFVIATCWFLILSTCHAFLLALLLISLFHSL